LRNDLITIANTLLDCTSDRDCRFFQFFMLARTLFTVDLFDLAALACITEPSSATVTHGISLLRRARQACRPKKQKEFIMRSTTRTTTALGIALGLAMIAVPQLAAAQAGSEFQDQGMREDSGYSAFSTPSASAYVSYGKATNKPERAATNKRPRTTASEKQRDATATQARAAAQEPVNAAANGAALPGYSARPDGKCWIREFGSGHDLTGGYWGACPKTH
jgi:hypothetical protein